MDLLLKILGTLFGGVSVCAALYNLATSYRNAKQLAQDNRQAAQLEAPAALAIRTEERVSGLEGRLGSFEQRIEKRIDQMATDVSDVKTLFTNYLIGKH